MKTILCAALLLGLAACSGDVSTKLGSTKRVGEVEIYFTVPQPDAAARMSAFCGATQYKILSVESKFPGSWIDHGGVPQIASHAYIKFECVDL